MLTHGRACLLHAGALEADKATEVQDAVRWDLRAKRAGIVKDMTSLVSVRGGQTRGPHCFMRRVACHSALTRLSSHCTLQSAITTSRPAWPIGPKGAPICAARTYTTVAVGAKLVVRLVALIHDLLEEAVGRRERLLHSSGRHPCRPPPLSGAQKARASAVG